MKSDRFYTGNVNPHVTVIAELYSYDELRLELPPWEASTTDRNLY